MLTGIAVPGVTTIGLFIMVFMTVLAYEKLPKRLPALKALGMMLALAGAGLLDLLTVGLVIIQWQAFIRG